MQDSDFFWGNGTLKEWELNYHNKIKSPRGNQTLGIQTSQECYILRESLSKTFRNYRAFTLISSVPMKSGSLKGLGFYPTCKLTN